MFNVGGGELIVIMLLALVVLGPTRLPSAARQMGRAMGELRRLSAGFQNEVRSAVREAEGSDRATAQQNLLAKESRVLDPAAHAAPAAATTDRPARRAPLKAAPSTPAGKKAANGAQVKAAQTAATGRSAAKKTAAKKGAVTRSAAKKAPSKAAAKRSSS